MEEDTVRLIVREEMNGKVMFKDSCKERHEKVNDTMEDFKNKFKTLDDRMWGVLVMCLIQLVGIIIVLLKGH